MSYTESWPGSFKIAEIAKFEGWMIRRRMNRDNPLVSFMASKGKDRFTAYVQLSEINRTIEGVQPVHELVAMSSPDILKHIVAIMQLHVPTYSEWRQYSESEK